MSEKPASAVADIRKAVIWGNHSATQYPDLSHCTVAGRPALEILDPGWVREQRRRILAGILPPGTMPTDDVVLWYSQLEAAIQHNDSVYQAWDAEGWDIDLDGAPLPYGYAPAGFVYGLPAGNVADCVMESVGPDMTGVGGGPPAP